MTKAELIDEVSKLSNLTKKETETIVNTIFDNITDALAQGDKVELRGFGSFRIRRRNSRKGRNPKTGSSVSVPEKRVPFFKVGKRLRELVNTYRRSPGRGSALGALAHGVPERCVGPAVRLLSLRCPHRDRRSRPPGGGPARARLPHAQRLSLCLSAPHGGHPLPRGGN